MTLKALPTLKAFINFRMYSTPVDCLYCQETNALQNPLLTCTFRISSRVKRSGSNSFKGILLFLNTTTTRAITLANCKHFPQHFTLQLHMFAFLYDHL